MTRRLVLCSLLIGCTSGGDAPDPEVSVAVAAASSSPEATATAATTDMPIEQAAPQVVMNDAKRVAQAFESGLVGRPPPSLASVAAKAAAATAGQKAGPPPSRPRLSVETASEHDVYLTYTCGATATQLVRTSPTFATIPTVCSEPVTADVGLQPGTEYCYAFQNPDGSIGSDEQCTQTVFAPYLFNSPTTHAITQAESDAMIAQFDWTHTNTVATTIPTIDGPQMALYSMDILVQTENDFYQLRNIGIHTQSHPLMPDEQAVWSGDVMKAMAQGVPVGTWISAIVPGPIYNDLRAQAIASIAGGRAFGIKAMVFHRINQGGGAFYPNPTIEVSPLSLVYLGQQGIAFNGDSPEACDPGPPRTCTIRQELFGWLLNKAISVVVSVVNTVIHEVRQLIGAIEKLVRGDVNVTLQLTLNNTDELFGVGDRARSGWSGQPLLLKNLPVRVYQGLAEFTSTTDAQGNAVVNVSKNLSGRICLVLENSRVKLIDTFIARQVCIGTFSATSSPMVWPQATTNHWVNELAAMTDAADYLQTVMSFNMAKLSVLTGWQSSIFTNFNGGRSFTPCMGRMPNLTANIALYASGGVVSLIAELGELAEFLTSYDIILATGDVRSRGIGVHEYGHAVMCELLRNTDQRKAASAWADVMVASTVGQQDPRSEPSVIAEGFADFIALQVVGGTNYVPGDTTRASRGISYCLGDATSSNLCQEAQSTRCDGASNCAHATNARWVVSVLQDVFDQPNPASNLPNDGSLWGLDSRQILVPHSAASQVSLTENDAIQLPGPRIRDIFNAWGSRGSTLRYGSFFGGVAAALRSNGYDLLTTCAMFAPHEQSQTCPSYVLAAYDASPSFNRGADVLVRNTTSGAIDLWTIAGTRQLSNIRLGAPGLDWLVKGSGDFNGDGHPDILWRNTNGQVAIWNMVDGVRLNDTYPGGMDPSHIWEIQGVGDFNADGRADILWRDVSGQLAIWFEGNNLDAAYPGYGNTPAPVEADWHVAGVGDFNADGQADILWRHDTGQMAVWPMSGGLRIGEWYPGIADPAIWSLVGLGDFDGDHATDILWRHTSGQLTIWLRGDVNQSTFPSYANAGGPVDLAWTVQGTTDFDADGRSDLLWAHTGGAVAIWFMANGQFRSDANPSFLDAGWQVSSVLGPPK